MIYTVDFLDTQTGERATGRYDEPTWDAPTDFGDPGWTTLVFMWEEGNFGCDCNRLHWMDDALGRPRQAVACGDGRVRVRLTLGDGKVAIDEMADGAA